MHKILNLLLFILVIIVISLLIAWSVQTKPTASTTKSLCKTCSLSKKEHNVSEKKIVFVHVPKAGGTSVKNGLCDEKRIESGEGHSVHLPRHENVFYFAVVRDPYERYRSIFYYLKQRYNQHKNGEQSSTFVCGVRASIMPRTNFNLLKSIGFESMTPYDFMKAIINDKRLQKIDIIPPQSKWVGPDKRTDMVIKLEDLDNGWKEFSRVAGIKHKALPKSRKTSQVKQEKLDEKTKALVRQFYRDDFVNLGYDV